MRENLERVRAQNLLGKPSRSRLEDILGIFRQRYLQDPQVARALAVLVQGGMLPQSLDRIFYFHAAQSDPLLHDVVIDLLAPMQWRGAPVTVAQIASALAEWAAEGRIGGRWSAGTALRVAQGLMASLRDFGVLAGAQKKRLACPYLPVDAFAYLAFVLKAEQPSGERLLGSSEWRLFFLPSEMVERLFIEAHQERLLEYHAAGRVIRIEFPTDSVEEYAHALVEGPH